MMTNKQKNFQTNISDQIMLWSRASDWYDKIWKNVGKCVFCDLKDQYIIFENNGIVLTANLYPYIDAHLLIIPRRHIDYTKEFTNEEWQAVRGMMYVAKKVLRKAFGIKNIWFLYREGALGEGQKTVGHLHIQVIPYEDGLFQINYRPISSMPDKLSVQLRKEGGFMKQKYERYLLKYGKHAGVEKRIVVNCVIRNSSGDILLIRKETPKDAKLMPCWETPAGSVEGDETLQQALQREIKEEVNLNIKNIKFVNISEDEQDVFFKEGFKKRWSLIFVNYTAAVESGKLKSGDDAAEAKWVAVENLKKYKLSKLTKKLLTELKLL